MKQLLPPILFAVFFAVGPVAGAADDECNFNFMLGGEDGSKPTEAQKAAKAQREAECRRQVAERRQQAAQARTRLKAEFGVDASKFSDQMAIGRLEEEIGKRDEKRQEDKERQARAADQQRMNQAAALMKQQDQMLKSQGVKVGSGAGADAGDDEYDAVELQSYQKMVDSGVAPQCKGRKGAALIECVDEALDEEEDP